MIEALNRGKAYTNVSTFYAEVAASSAKPELVDRVAKQATAHPTDTHPPTGQRIEALRLTVSGLRDEALQVDASSAAALLFDKVTEMEEFLTEVEHRVLLELGHTMLPEVAKTLGLCPNCENAIPINSKARLCLARLTVLVAVRTP